MKHYKDVNGAVFAVEDGQEVIVKPDWVLMTNAEYLSFVNPPKTAEQEVADEQAWVVTEMSVADIEINKHLDGDARAIATEANWRAYRCQLRDYVKGGQIVGERPQRPV